MFIKVTRSAAVSALAAGREVRLDATGEILQLEAATRSKRAARRILSRFCPLVSCMTGKYPQVTFSIRV